MKEQVIDKNVMLDNISLQLAELSHEEFLLKVFKESRPDLIYIDGISENEKTKIIHNQFAIEQQQLMIMYPNAKFNVIKLKEELIGRLYINYGEKTDHILEIGILEKYRNIGIGREIMINIIENALKKRKNVSLQVAWFNQNAFSFYERLGFHVIRNSGAFYEMQYK